LVRCLCRFLMPTSLMFGFRYSHLECEAVDLVAHEVLARRARLSAIKPREACAVVGLGALGGALDIGFGVVICARDPFAGRDEVLLGFALVLISADLDGPTGACRWLGRNGCRVHLRLQFG